MSNRQGGAGFRIDDSHAHAGQWVADLAALGADLAEARRAKIVVLTVSAGGAFRAAVGFDRAKAEFFLEGRGDAVGNFSPARARTEAAEIVGIARAQIELKERGRGEEIGDGVLRDERPDGLLSSGFG